MGLITFVLKWAFIIIALILVLIIGIGVYFYNFHVFKTVTFCVSNNPLDSGVSCKSNSNCYELLSNFSNFSSVNNSNALFILEQARQWKANSLLSEEAPPIIRATSEQILEESFSCSELTNRCEFRKVTNNLVDSDKQCLPEEKQIVIKIRGKDAYALYKFLKNSENSINQFG